MHATYPLFPVDKELSTTERKASCVFFGKIIQYFEKSNKRNKNEIYELISIQKLKSE